MKYTIKDLQRDFPTDEACLDWLVGYLYPDGIYCKVCEKTTPHHRMRTRKSYSCETCGHHVHPTANTIFHKSTTPLTLWFYAIYLMAQTRAGISAKQLERELGVTYKTAWRMFHQIRSMMGDDESDNLTGEVEVDETYVHPNPQKRSTAKPHDNQIVFGMVERGGRAKVRHVKSSGTRVLMPEIESQISNRAVVYSDEWGAYKTLKRRGYYHETIIHSNRQYVRGVVHTQNVENLWSTMKRGIKGVYRHVDAKYLQAYADEYAFRYSHRKSAEPMFFVLLNRVANSN
ncbi:MAG TPA: IS1595 family transposase [Candidatus Saccharimonadales bacterium]|nr:IS1595 family transposase [Candidatus Saccharimonadales bacterium]